MNSVAHPRAPNSTQIFLYRSNRMRLKYHVKTVIHAYSFQFEATWSSCCIGTFSSTVGSLLIRVKIFRATALVCPDRKNLKKFRKNRQKSTIRQKTSIFEWLRRFTRKTSRNFLSVDKKKRATAYENCVTACAPRFCRPKIVRAVLCVHIQPLLSSPKCN